MSKAVSRRDLLLGPMRRLRTCRSAVIDEAGTAPLPNPNTPQVAVIMGRHCLAYRHVTCSSCYERCPEEGAIVRERGIPRIITDRCTGCQICRDVCPAPTNAVLLIGGKFAARRSGDSDDPRR